MVTQAAATVQIRICYPEIYISGFKKMDLPNVSKKHRWSIVGLLFTASLISYLDRAAISFALPLISRDFHLTSGTKGLLLSSFFWSYALMQVPIGWCADRFNLRWLYAGAFALWSFAQGLTGLAGSLAALIGFRVLLGVGESIYLPGGTKIEIGSASCREREQKSDRGACLKDSRLHER